MKVDTWLIHEIREHVLFLVYQKTVKKPKLTENYLFLSENFDIELTYWNDRPNDPNFMTLVRVRYQEKDHYFIRINYQLETDFTHTYELYDSDHNYLKDEEIKVFF